MTDDSRQRAPVEMTWSQMWSVCGRIFHAGDYRAVHADILAAAIGDRDRRVLDTACGVGFPMLELIERGYRRITGADADPVLLAELADTLAARGLSVPLIETAWQDITDHVADQFDVVLNVDASICLMDSWATGAMTRGEEHVFARVTSVLRNFHDLVAPGGALIVGLQKNNDKANRTRRVVDVGRIDVGGRDAALEWQLDYDWDTRIKQWNSVLTIDGERHERLLELYLFDKHELADMLRAAGFASVFELDTPPPLYEDLLCARV